jgi:VanZ family protein
VIRDREKALKGKASRVRPPQVSRFGFGVGKSCLANGQHVISNDSSGHPQSLRKLSGSYGKGAIALGMVCLALLFGMLIAGLWPFHSPRNQVSWAAHGGGLTFGQHGTTLSTGRLGMEGRAGRGPCSLEIWLSPGKTWSKTVILAFYTPREPGGFSLRQSDRGLLLESAPWSHPVYARFPRLKVHDVFRQGRPVFIAATSDGHKTAVYVNGARVRESGGFAVSARDLTDRIVVANSPVADDSWSGELRGLAIYDHLLTAAQVLRHYETWTQTRRPKVIQGEDAVALYLFNEGAGSVIHNQVASGANLCIPKRYQELHHTFLERPWNEYHPAWSYWKDLLINIGGFVPFGFFLYAYIITEMRVRRAALLTVITGTAVSLTIEILQAFLPTRDSGMTDLVTNTMGTWGGVMMYQCASVVCPRLSRSQFAGIRWIAALLPLAPGHPESGNRVSEDVLTGV